jgi:hypothetical protein
LTRNTPNGEVEYEVYSTFGKGRYIRTWLRPCRITTKRIDERLGKAAGRVWDRDGKNIERYYGSNYRYVVLRYRIAGEPWTVLAAPSHDDPTTLRAYDRLDASSRRAGLVRCPACDDYMADDYAPKRDHAATCAALRALAETPEAGR